MAIATERSGSWLPLAWWAVAVALVALGAVVDQDTFIPATGDVWINVGLVAAFPAAGALILRHRPRHPVGWLLTGIGVSCGITFASHAIAVYGIVLHPGTVPGAGAAAWLNEWVWTTGAMPAVALLPAFFPDGRLPNLPARIAAVAGGTAVAMLAIGAAFRPKPFENFPSVRNPVGIAPLDGVMQGLQVVGFPLFLVATIAALASVVVRWRRSDASGRRQLKWFVAATAFLVVSVVLDATGTVPRSVGATLVTVAPALIAAAVVVAVVRHRLYDIDVVVNRSLVYAALTALLVAVYAAGVATLGAVLGRFAASVATTAVVAVVFDPIRRRVQALVDRLLYGDRSAVEVVLQDLADQLASATTPATALLAVTDAAVAALGAPGAAAVILDGDRVVAEQTTGTVGAHTATREITVRGVPVGELTYGLRRGDERPTRRRRRQRDDTLARLLRAAELAASTVLLTAELQRSRAEAVTAREEERRRIRRDLHDGLGPRLAGLALGIEGVHASSTSAGGDLSHLASEAYATIDEVRALVHDLRPSALDDLGLLRAIRERAAALVPAGATTSFDIQAPDELPALPAAVEVAAFRITSEAMTNVVRHAAASVCTVTIDVGPTDLVLTIDDDGVGMNGQAREPGLGLGSMRERAIELGGTFAMGARSPNGTRIIARLPRTT